MPFWRIIVPVGASAGAAAAGFLAFGPESQLTSRVRPLADAQGIACRIEFARQQLHADARESSGLARGITHQTMLWTHNDAGGDPVLFGFDETAGTRTRVPVEGAEFVDWEDIEAAACPSGACLYIGDIGDNDAERDSIVVYEVTEPGPDQRSVSATAFPARYPDGPRDSEALFAHGGNLYIVTKGRHGPIALYRFPAMRAPGKAVTLEAVAQIGPQPRNENDRVTAATASPDGRWIAATTYRWLLFYPAAALLQGRAGEAGRFDLRTLDQDQIEAVALGNDGRVWLSSEAQGKGSSTWSRLACSLP